MKLTDKAKDILRVVQEHDGEYTAAEIGEALGVSSRSVNATLNFSLCAYVNANDEKEPLVKRVEHEVEEDGDTKTIKLIYVTDAGRDFDLDAEDAE